jgi:hypothetical protein
VRRRYEGYIFLFTASDHDGRHIHVYCDNQEIGVFDRVDGPIRGLGRVWNKRLQAGLERFIGDLNDRGYFNG